MADSTLYDDDIVAWSEQQAAALRGVSAKRSASNEVDWENVIEEIESVGRSQVTAVESLLIQILGTPPEASASCLLSGTATLAR